MIIKLLSEWDNTNNTHFLFKLFPSSWEIKVWLYLTVFIYLSLYLVAELK